MAASAKAKRAASCRTRFPKLERGGEAAFRKRRFVSCTLPLQFELQKFFLLLITCSTVVVCD
jgi:hypothetical protein